jgi:hypothetical protein
VDDFDAILDLTRSCRAPSLPLEEIDKKRAEIITLLLRQDADNPAVAAVETLMARIYPNGPSLRPQSPRHDRIDRTDRSRVARRLPSRAVRAVHDDGDHRRRRGTGGGDCRDRARHRRLAQGPIAGPSLAAPPVKTARETAVIR